MVTLSRAVMANIKQNIAVALGLKAVFLVTTVIGVTGLWPAILADTGATVLVTANAMRLLSWGRNERIGTMTRSGVISLWVRRVAATVAFVLLLGLASVAQAIEVLTTSGCGCCIGWARHMEENGFAAELKNLPMADLMQVKIGAGLKPG